MEGRNQFARGQSPSTLPRLAKNSACETQPVGLFCRHAMPNPSCEADLPRLPRIEDLTTQGSGIALERQARRTAKKARETCPVKTVARSMQE